MSNQEQNTKTSPKPGGAMFGGNAAVPGEKAKNFKNSFGKLLRYMGKFKVLLILVVIFAVCSTIFTIVGPKILGMATTKLHEGIMSSVSGTDKTLMSVHKGKYALYTDAAVLPAPML